MATNRDRSASVAGQAAQTPFASLVEQLSEPNGEFDTDNLISNESSYLHVMPALEQGGVTGGVYIGVGPDQNFSYIARIRPAAAFIIDIRRDNLLLHLLFKAIFASSRNRMEYLSVLTGRPAPDRAETWRDASIEKIVTYLDDAKPLPAAASADDDRAAARGDQEDRHAAVRGGSRHDRSLSRPRSCTRASALQFQSTGRPAREYYPTYRDLLLETRSPGPQALLSRVGRRLSVREGARSARRRHSGGGQPRSGPHALAAIGQEIAKRGEKVVGVLRLEHRELSVPRRQLPRATSTT